MPRVSHILSCLTGPLILTRLKADIRVPHSTDLLFAEIPPVFLGHFGAQRRSRVFRMQLSLND